MKITLVLLLSTLVVIGHGQRRFNQVRQFGFNQANQFQVSRGSYRASSGSDGQYRPDNSGSYKGSDGQYHPDDSGAYVHDDSKYVHQDNKYQHTGDKFGKDGGNFGGQGGFGSGADAFVDANQGQFQGSGFGSGAGVAAGFSSGADSGFGQFKGTSAGAGDEIVIGSGASSSAGLKKTSGLKKKTGSNIQVIGVSGSGAGAHAASLSGGLSGSGALRYKGSGHDGAGVAPAAGFGAPVALKQGSAAGFYDNRHYGIIRKEEHVEDDGYHYLYETENGITGEEQGKLANRGTDDEAMHAHGFYTYTGPDSIVYTVRYTADENGFVPEGDHLPTPPPIPDAILRALEYQRSLGKL